MRGFASGLMIAAALSLCLVGPITGCSPVSSSAEKAAARAAKRAAERQGAQRAAAALATRDIVLRRWHAVMCQPTRRCPLPRDIADSFAGSSYDEILLGSDTVLFRVYAREMNRMGPAGKRYTYWSRSDARGTQAVVDGAIPVASNGNVATRQVAIRVPKGTTVFEGKTQGIPHGGPVGGGNQVVIDGVRQEWVIK